MKPKNVTNFDKKSKKKFFAQNFLKRIMSPTFIFLTPKNFEKKNFCSELSETNNEPTFRVFKLNKRRLAHAY